MSTLRKFWIDPGSGKAAETLEQLTQGLTPGFANAVQARAVHVVEAVDMSNQSALVRTAISDMQKRTTEAINELNAELSLHKGMIDKAVELVMDLEDLLTGGNDPFEKDRDVLAKNVARWLEVDIEHRKLFGDGGGTPYDVDHYERTKAKAQGGAIAAAASNPNTQAELDFLNALDAEIDPRGLELEHGFISHKGMDMLCDRIDALEAQQLTSSPESLARLDNTIIEQLQRANKVQVAAMEAKIDTLHAKLLKAVDHIEDCIAHLAEVSPATTMVAAQKFVDEMDKKS